MTVSNVPHDPKQRGKQIEIDLVELMTPTEAAAMIRVKPATLAQWRGRRKKSLRFIRAGRVIRYRKQDVLAFLEHATIDPLAARG